jgi:hypothetical protein
MVYNQSKPIRLHNLHLKLFSSYDLGNLELQIERVFHLMCLIYEHLLTHHWNLFRIQNLVQVRILILVQVQVLPLLELVLELVTMVQLLLVNLLELGAQVQLYGNQYFVKVFLMSIQYLRVLHLFFLYLYFEINLVLLLMVVVVVEVYHFSSYLYFDLFLPMVVEEPILQNHLLNLFF